MFNDINNPSRTLARSFAKEHGCSLRTAEYYVWTYGESEQKPNKQKVTAEFEKAGKKMLQLSIALLRTTLAAIVLRRTRWTRRKLRRSVVCGLKSEELLT